MKKIVLENKEKRGAAVSKGIHGKFQISQVLELKERFGIDQPDHIARALRIPVEEAKKLLQIMNE